MVPCGHDLYYVSDRFRPAKREELERQLVSMRRRTAAEGKTGAGDFGGEFSSNAVRGTMTPGLYFQSAFHTFALILQGEQITAFLKLFILF